MEGFFFKEKPIKKKARISREGSKKPRKEGCEACGLYKTCITPKMSYTGKGRKKILIIGEAPGSTEDEKGVQLIGDAGQTLRRHLFDLGIVLDRDCWKTKAIICRPPHNATPTSRQIGLCRPNLEKTLQELKPEKIILFGKIAIQSFLHGRESVSGAEKWIGWQIPDQDYKAWVFPNYHPQYLNYNADDRLLHKFFDRYIKKAVDWEKSLPDNSKDKEKVTILYDIVSILSFLRTIRKGATIAIDIETTGRKPHKKGHRIVSMSIAISENKSIAFPFLQEEAFIREVRRILTDKEIKKVGQNIKYEDTWFRVLTDTEIESWIFDTMLGIHVLDNRSGITGLKFQAYVYEGVCNYNKDVENLITTEDKDGNAFNKIDEVPLDKLLLYNGLDSLYTFRAYKRYIKMMQPNDWEGYKLLHDGTLELSKIEAHGIRSDTDYLQKEFKHLARRMAKIDEKIINSKEAKIWKKKAPGKYAEQPFNHSSSTQLRILLYDLLNYPVNNLTKANNPSADQEALEGIDKPFIKDILQHRKLKKIKDTALLGFIREQWEGYIHPVYNLNIVKTYRSSSNNPNFQNVPVHDEQAGRIIRTGIIPRPGRRLVEVDYSGIEVRVSACYHRDPTMIKYIKNPESDMHRDTASELFLRDKKDISKQERFIAKNNFVFAEFYGDYFGNIAPNIWKNMESSTKEHLYKSGIKKYSTFEGLVQDVEDKFWSKRFKVYAAWKEKTWLEYQRKGFYTYHTGFSCRGHMGKNEVVNYPIQGSAFHCLLWSLIQVNRFLREHKFETMIIGQIHDSLVMDRVEDEAKELMPAVKKIMTIDIREAFPWIIVPLDIEAKVSEIDGNWFDMTEEEIRNGK